MVDEVVKAPRTVEGPQILAAGIPIVTVKSCFLHYTNHYFADKFHMKVPFDQQLLVR